MLEHKHLIIRAEVSNCPSKNNLDEVLDWMKSLTLSIHMKVMLDRILLKLIRRVTGV